eukprot:1156619-Pelagomonas_calceolata.AAC.10
MDAPVQATRELVDEPGLDGAKNVGSGVDTTLLTLKSFGRNAVPGHGRVEDESQFKILNRKCGRGDGPAKPPADQTGPSLLKQKYVLINTNRGVWLLPYDLHAVLEQFYCRLQADLALTLSLCVAGLE